MKPRAMFTAVILAALLALPQMAGAVWVHTFNCKNCHIPSLSVTQLGGGNVCLTCHDEDKTLPLNDGTQGMITSGFSEIDASNAMGNNKFAVPGKGQTSHNWGAPDNQPAAAGAVPPSRDLHPQFYSNQGASHGRVTCSRCHEPHAERTNPKLLAKGPGSTEAMCTACHVPFVQGSGMSHKSHPVDVVYPVGNSSYQAPPPNVPGGIKDINNDQGVVLYDNKVVCGTCHQVHFADSNPTTQDVPAGWDTLSFDGGDGKLLRSYGRRVGDPVKSSDLCQTCHVYQTHGGTHFTLGCLDCHGGHSPSGNYYMLRPQVTQLGYVPKTGASGNSGALAYQTTDASWMNGGGSGYCQGCHAIPVGGDGKHNGFASGGPAQCATCHNHTTESGSFTGSCNACHGYAPDQNVAGGPRGYAVDAERSPTFDYLNNGVNPKNEAITAHINHADNLGVGSGNYKFQCQACHDDANFTLGGGGASLHRDGVFGNIVFGATAKVGMTPAYNGAGNGTCSNIYCHSNGGKRVNDTTRTYVIATVPAWQGGRDAITGCTACHGNDATTMAAGQKNNSNSHAAHLNKGYSCNVCHSNTASSNTVLKELGGEHVNGTADVLFDGGFLLGGTKMVNGTPTPAVLGSGTYGNTQGTCSVYCHGNGTAKVTPDWDSAASGTCGTCHQVSVAGAPAGSGPALNGVHSAHVFSASGPHLGCNYCHTNSGSGADHVNGAVSLIDNIQATCNECHGATAGQTTGNDREPVWANAATVSCATCHVGVLAEISGRTAPAKNSFYTLGHGDPTLPNGSPNCAGCHALTVAHIDGATNSAMLTGAAAANDAFCQSCHGVKGSHFANNGSSASTAANTCYACHEAHGEGMGTNTDAMLIVGSGFTDKTQASSYWNAGFTGVCQVCHDPAGGTGGIKYYNRTTAANHNPGQRCTNCHTHNDTPAFRPGAGTSCDSCHDYPPNTAAHAKHAPESLALDAAGDVFRDATNGFADVSSCAHCHTGAHLYTYAQSDDASSGVAGRQNHGSGNRAAVLTASVGYSAATQNCTVACHSLASGQAAAWTATSLACDACHGNPPANGGGSGSAHAKHVAHAQVDCATCHVAIPTDTAHISVKTGANEFERVQNAAKALADEANVVVDTWSDANNSCANAACHNPSNDGKIAFWGPTTPSTSSCTLCHGNAATIASGSHAKHLYLDNSCTNCHTAIVGGMAHLNFTVNMQGALNYNTNASDPKIPNTCNSTVCHFDPQGKNGTPDVRETDPWGTPIANTCGICHGSPSFEGDHVPHFSAGRVAKGMTCYSCHAGTVGSDNKLIPLASSGKHLDGGKTDVLFAGNYNGQPVTADVPYNPLVDPSTCSVSCHATGNPKGWAPPSSCADCHGNLNADPRHAAHINIVPSIEADRSECVVCHGSDVVGYQLFENGSHMDGTINFAAGIADGGTAPDYTCTAACHVSTAAVDGHWADANGLGCDACHAYPMQDGAHEKHVLAGMDCGSCHGTVDAAGTSPLTHNHGKDLDSNSIVSDAESLTTRGKAIEVSAGHFTVNLSGLDIHVDDSAYSAGAGNTWVNSNVVDDGGNSCANVLCHNPSATVGKNVDWDEDEASCSLCHGHDGAVGPMIVTGSHGNHLNAAAKFGISIGCNRCHPDNTGNFAHFLTGTPKVPKGAVQFGGTVITNQYQGEAALPNSGYGTCSTNACHNNGMGGAPITGFTWGTPVATDCQFCHDDPPTSGRHQVHLGTIVNYGPYGGVASTNCGDCHAANNDLTMTGRDTHMNGALNFSDGNSVVLSAALTDGIVVDAGVTACNNCHGAQAATANANAALAKSVWHAGTAPDCGSCHGDFGPATSKADGTGVTAPARAGSDYLSAGHGKASTPADALIPANRDKAINKGCADCHDRTVAHISGTLGDVNRLKALSGKNYENLAQRNDWCAGCHSSTAHGHFANTNTPAGDSDDGLYCAVCHDPHGQGGQDAMVATTIQGSLVSGFADRKLRASYSNATYTGVCQVCHDNGEVQYFNRTTDSLGSHMGESQCSDCHKHTDNPAFQASGCSGCHGGGYFDGTTTWTNNYWPDSSNARPENTAGRHVKHVERIAGVLYGETIAQLLTDTGNGATDTKQKAICAYCHTGPGVTNHNNGVANVNSMFNLWGAPPAMDNGVWTAGSNSGNCSNVNCHNNETTPTGYGWYGANTATCTMCHSTTAPDNLLANNIHPSTGLHRVVNTSVVQSHNATMVGGGCAACHDPVKAIPGGAKLGLTGGSNSHMDGVAFDNTASNGDRFLKAGIAFAEGPANFATCGGTGGSNSFSIFSCHTDRGNWKRLWSKDADKVEYNTPGVPSSGPIWGGARCSVCHGFPDGAGGGWRVGVTVDHNAWGNLLFVKHGQCEICHVAPSGDYAEYVYLTKHEDGKLQINAGASTGAPDVGFIESEGSCTNTCHGGEKKSMGQTQVPSAASPWPAELLRGTTASCNACHSEYGGGLKGDFASLSFDNGGESVIKHQIHVEISANKYADLNNNSSDAQYSYGCANCHPNDIGHHVNGVVEVSLNSTHGGQTKSKNNTTVDPEEYASGTFSALNNWAINSGGIAAFGPKGSRNLTCNASYCHSDGKGTANSTTPNWYGGFFPTTSDRCAGCHQNSPAGTSHQPHNVGIHYNNIYTGNTGVVKDAALKQNAHGVGDNSTTMSCYLCHNNTIKEKTNARNSVCISCHTPVVSPAPADIAAGNAEAVMHSRVYHINGSPDVWFADVSVLSRAQLRDPLSNVPDVQAAWKRQNGYKSQVPGVTSFDQTWDWDANLARKLDTNTMYEPSTKNCTVACHNNVQIGWGATTISCSNCHTQLPK